MAASSARRDLFISVNGSVDNLSNSLKAGRTALLDFNAATGSIVEEVERKFKEMGSGAGSGAEELARNYTSAAKRIQSSMQEALRSGNPADALKIFDVNSLNEQIAKTEQLAVANRKIAEAAETASKQGGQYAQVQLAIAAASAQAAVKGEAEVVALRAQAGALGEVGATLAATSGAQQESSGTFVNSARAQRFAMVSLGQQFTDFTVQATTGAGVVRAFAQQMPQATFALSGFGGRLGTVGAFLNGPWGIGLQIAVLSLAPFISGLLESGKALDGETDKLKKDAAAAQLARQAKELFRVTEVGVTAAIYDQADALKAQADNLRSTAEQTAITARFNQLVIEQTRDHTRALLEEAQAQLEVFKIRSQAPGQRGEVATLGLEGAQGRVDALTAKLAANEAARAQADKNYQTALAGVAAEAGKTANDPVAVITRKYEGANGLIALAQARLVKEKATEEVMGRQLALLYAQEAAEKKKVEAANSKPKVDRSNDQIGRTINVAEATSIVESIGGRVTSGTRSYDQQAGLYAKYRAGTGSLAAPPGTSAHETGQAVDVAKSAGITAEKLKRAFEAAGVRITQLLDEGNHFHVAFNKRPKTGDEEARSAEDAAQKERERVAAFNAELTQAQGDYLQAQAALAEGADEQLNIVLSRIETERADRDAEINRQVIGKKLTAAEAAQLKDLADRTADARKTAATNRALARTLDQNLETARNELRGRIALLDLQGNLADTMKARRRIALQILDLEEQDRRKVAQRLLASPDQDGRDEGARQMTQIDREHGARVEGVNRQTEGPLAQWKRDAIDTKSILESIEVKGLDQLNDGLTDAVKNALHLHGIFGDLIGDLIKLALHKAEVAAIDAIFGAATGGGGFLTKLFHKDGVIPGYADGIIRGPGTGTSDSIPGWMAGAGPIMVSDGEGIMNARAVRNYGPILKAMNDNSIRGFAAGAVPSFPSLPSAGSLSPSSNREPIVIHLATTKGEAFDTDVISVSGPHAVEIFKAGAPTMIQAATRNTIATLGRPGL